MTRKQSSLPGRLVTLIGVSFFTVEFVILIVFTGFHWHQLRQERQEDVARYATGVRDQVRLALRGGGNSNPDGLDQALDAAVQAGAGSGQPSRGHVALPDGPMEAWVFTRQGQWCFDPPSGQLLANSRKAWTRPIPPSVQAALDQLDEVAPHPADESPLRITWVEPIPSGGAGAPLGVLYLDSSLRDVQRQVAQYAVAAFAAGAIALFISAMFTIGYLRRSLLHPLSIIVTADNAARRGDEKGGVIDANEIPDDEVGAIMRSRNRLFVGMIRACRDLDEKNAQLEQQQDELRAWGERLEGLVEEKSSALLKARDRLHRNEKLAALGRLSANVAHEINNPLASIAGYAEAATEDLREGDTAEVSAALRTIEEQAFRCKDILKRLLSLARTDEVDPVELDLGGLVRETVTLSEPAARKRGVAIEVDIPPAGPSLRSNPGSLQQVVLNLVENAVDAAARADGQGRVRVGIVDDDPERVHLVVADNGQGIPPDVLPRVFDPFYTTKPVGRGTGLGLAISQSLIERLGGRITVDPDSSGGATFRVALPRDEAEAVTQAPLQVDSGFQDAPTLVDHTAALEAQIQRAGAEHDPEG